MEKIEELIKDIYSPIFFKGKLYKEHENRSFLKQIYQKLSLFPIDFKKE